MVRLAPASWRALLAGRPDLEGLPLVATWAERGWPLVVRRPLCGEAGLALGLPLPPALGKRRLSFLVEPSAVLSIEPPPRLADTVPVAPAAWGPTLHRLLALDPETRTFGSLAWQHLTGLPYLSPTSDIDLLWRLDGSAERLLAGLAAIDRDAPMRLDGECIGPGGVAVQWRELAGDAPEIMVKSLRDVALVSRAALLSDAGC
jgi:phosphoribosyl-dephospho-CoA transferase